MKIIFTERITDTGTTTTQVAAWTMEVWTTITMGIVGVFRAAVGILTRACLN
jgi:hypothetical protein